jgi:hypothetical protein
VSKERGSSDQLACGSIPYHGNADFTLMLHKQPGEMGITL